MPAPTRFIDRVRITARWVGEPSHIRTVVLTPRPRPLVMPSASPRRRNPPPADTRERWARTPRCMRKPANRLEEPSSEGELCKGRSPFLARAWLILAIIALLAAALRAREAGAVAGRAS